MQIVRFYFVSQNVGNPYFDSRCISLNSNLYFNKLLNEYAPGVINNEWNQANFRDSGSWNTCSLFSWKHILCIEKAMMKEQTEVLHEYNN